MALMASDKHSVALDRYDRAILQLLQRGARITNAKMAEQVSLSESACLRRVRALEEARVIGGNGQRSMRAGSVTRSIFL
jgi:DNA-binding Lrp family transcriptional regulator